MEQKYDYGICRFCGAKMVKNPKTGKIFCSEKCWDKGTKFVKQGNELKVREEPNWEQIRQERDKAIRENMELKGRGLAKGAAFNKSVDIAIALYQKGDITSDFILSKINELFTELKEINSDGE